MARYDLVDSQIPGRVLSDPKTRARDDGAKKNSLACPTPPRTQASVRNLAQCRNALGM